LLSFQVIQEVVDLVENGVQPLPVRGWHVGKRGIDLLVHVVQFVLGKLDELPIGGRFLDLFLEPQRQTSGIDQRFPLRHG